MTIENEVIALPHEPGEEPYIYMKKRKYKELDDYKHDTKNVIIPVLEDKIKILKQVLKLHNIDLPKEK